MIVLNRIRTAKAINAKYRGADKKERDKELMVAQRLFLKDMNKPIIFNSKFWKTAKTQLKKESNGKCAYCEADTQVVAHGDVEHFRPKHIYWWMAYTYDNYLYACQICNQMYKNDNFPINGKKISEPNILSITADLEIEQLAGNISPDPIDVLLNYTLQKYLDEHNAENGHLINPYIDNPAIYFAYEADDILKEVKIIPTTIKYEKQVKAAEDFYGINRIELKNARYSIFRKFRAFKNAYDALPNLKDKREIKKQIDDMLTDKHIFSGMNRFFNNKF